MLLLAWSSLTFAGCFAHSIVEHISDGEAIFHRFFVSESKLSERELTRYLDAIENNPAKFPPEKTMVTVKWLAAGMIHYTFLEPGRTITAESYCGEIDEMCRTLRELQPALVNRRGPILLLHNARLQVPKSDKRHSEFVTKEVRRIFEKLPARTSSDLVTFVNEIRGGHVDLSSDPQHVVTMIELRMPELGGNINAALKMLRSTIGKMTPFSKAAFQEHWTRFFESLSAPTTLRSIFLAAFYADIIESHKTARIAVRKEIQDLSPETDLLLKRTLLAGGSGTFLKSHVLVHTVLNNLPKPSAQ